MNEFRINQQPSTLSSVVIMSSILACCCLPNKIHSDSTIIKNEPYILNNNSSTFSEYGNFSKTSKNEEISEYFKQTVGEFYSNLLLSQENLGEEFESVLFNNLWELYES